MGRQSEYPFCTGLRVVGVDGKIVFEVGGPNMRDGDLAAINGCIAVSEDGQRVAWIDWKLQAHLVDGQGKPVKNLKVDSALPDRPREKQIPYRCVMTADGKRVMFADRNEVVLCSEKGDELFRKRFAEVIDADLAADGSVVYVGLMEGQVLCLGADGKSRWTYQSYGARPYVRACAAGVLVAEGAGNLLLLDGQGKVARKTELAAATVIPVEHPVQAFAGPALYQEPPTLAVLKKYGAELASAWKPGDAGTAAFGKTFHPVSAELVLKCDGKNQALVHLVYRHQGKGPRLQLSGSVKPVTYELDLSTPEYRVVDLPAPAKGLEVRLTPAAGLEVAAFELYTFKFPGVNCAFIKPAGAEAGDLKLTDDAPAAGGDTDDLVLDPEDADEMGKKFYGKLKKVRIASPNTDVNRVAGPYLRNGVNPLLFFDGKGLHDEFPPPLMPATVENFASSMGCRLLIDLLHPAKPKVCAIYERTRRQSAVTKGLAILQAQPGELEDHSEDLGPEVMMGAPRVIQARRDNDQFFHVFDLSGTTLPALGVFVYGGDGADHGLSEVELYE